MRKRILACGPLLLVAVLALAQQPEPEVHGEFEGEPMYTVLPPDAIPAIRDPEYLSGDAARAQMTADEDVMGVLVGEVPRAYSLWQLDSHEIVNDADFAVTW